MLYCSCGFFQNIYQHYYQGNKWEDSIFISRTSPSDKNKGHELAKTISVYHFVPFLKTCYLTKQWPRKGPQVGGVTHPFPRKPWSQITQTASFVVRVRTKQPGFLLVEAQFTASRTLWWCCRGGMRLRCLPTMAVFSGLFQTRFECLSWAKFAVRWFRS